MPKLAKNVIVINKIAFFYFIFFRKLTTSSSFLSADMADVSVCFLLCGLTLDMCGNALGLNNSAFEL